jgi:2-oxoacid:acceptor oxidoreductase gamma subunit (pyruvate/2-ketoisovalerate family)
LHDIEGVKAIGDVISVSKRKLEYRETKMKRDVIQIRWHGRGGQGAITAAKIVANAAFSIGYGGVVMVPTFGTERRGAPVFTSLKISREKIYDLSPIKTPDIVVILDHLLIEEADVINGLKAEGLIVLNTPKPLDAYEFGDMKLAIADVTALATKAGLKKGVVNTGIIGAFARASGLIDLDILLNYIEDEFKGRRSHENAEAAKLTYNNTIVGES